MARKETGVRHGQIWKAAQNGREDAAALAHGIKDNALTALNIPPAMPADAARLVGQAAIDAQKIIDRLREIDPLYQDLYSRTHGTTPDADTSDAAYKRRKGDK